MNYLIFNVEDFLFDQKFLHWVKNGKNDSFWQNFQLKYPEKKAEMENARVIILAGVSLSYTEPSLKVKNVMWKNIQSQMTEKIAEIELGKAILFRNWRWAAAAVLLMGSIIGLQLKLNKGSNDKITYENMVSSAKTSSFIERVNNSEKTLLINLPDGSSVLLQKGGKLSYDVKLFGEEKREVYLSGEAFFEVSKNSFKPFFVYANELVAKVLGTSFTVKALANGKQVEVLVKTGRVSVFTQNDSFKNRKLNNHELEGVVLSPNQQIILEGTKLRLSHTLVQNPEMLAISAQKISFDFDDVPASKVFDSIEKAYGINFIYDKELLANCKLTAHLNDEPLNDKIRLICEVLQAHYEIIDTRVVITSKGCVAE